LKIELFKTNSAPSHRAKATQHFLPGNTLDFISSQEWTPHSPDLNPLNYSFRISCKNSSMEEDVNRLQTWKIFNQSINQSKFLRWP